METRASHLLIGSFVLLFVAGIFVFVVWLAKIQVDREWAYYQILFTESVTGLGVGSDVRFNGIKVGSVTAIAIDRDDPAKARVIVQVDQETPIRADSMASLEPQGITGLSFVNISGGSREAQILPVVHRERGELPQIASRPSKLSELFAGAPDMINRAMVLIDRASDLVNEENRRNVSNIIADLRAVTGRLASREDAITRIIDAFDRSSADVAEAARSVRSIAERIDGLAGETAETMRAARGTLGSVDRLVNGEAKELVVESRKAAASLGRLTQELEGLVAENRGPINDFAGDGLAELRRFVNEARVLVASFARVAARLEDDPSQVLFGARDARFKPEDR